jgi:hypothetical protein
VKPWIRRTGGRFTLAVASIALVSADAAGVAPPNS